MLDFIVYIAILGSVLAGLWDLRTTEVPDDIPVLMSSVGVFYWFAYSLSSGNYFPLAVSVVSGPLLLVFGMALYYKGQWGGADALLLASIAYMMPVYRGSLFIADYVFNLFLAGSAYMMAYSVIIGLMNRHVFGYFIGDVKENKKFVLGIPLAFAGFIALAYWQFGLVINNAFYTVALVFSLVLFWRYAVVIEQKVFRKKIPARELKAGDVLDSMIWRGITDEEIKEAIRKNKFVVIKEGVRFVPAFPIALIVTLLYGNLAYYLIAL